MHVAILGKSKKLRHLFVYVGSLDDGTCKVQKGDGNAEFGFIMLIFFCN